MSRVDTMETMYDVMERVKILELKLSLLHRKPEELLEVAFEGYKVKLLKQIDVYIEDIISKHICDIIKMVKDVHGVMNKVERRVSVLEVNHTMITIHNPDVLSNNRHCKRQKNTRHNDATYNVPRQANPSITVDANISSDEGEELNIDNGIDMDDFMKLEVNTTPLHTNDGHAVRGVSEMEKEWESGLERESKNSRERREREGYMDREEGSDRIEDNNEE